MPPAARPRSAWTSLAPKARSRLPGSRGLLVAPGTTRSVILAGLAPGQERLSVRVRSAGGPVAAVIQQSVLRGLTPGGVEFIAPAAAPALRQVISGRRHPGSGRRWRTSPAKPGFADAGPALQIAVPGTADAVVAIKLYRSGRPKGAARRRSGHGEGRSRHGGPPRRRAGRTLHRGRQLGRLLHRRCPRHAGTARPRTPPTSPGPPASARLGSQHVVPVPGTGDRLPRFRRPRGPGDHVLHAGHGGRQDPDRGRSRRHCRRHHRVHQDPRRRRGLAARRLPRVRRGRSRLRRTSCCSRTAGRTSPRWRLRPGAAGQEQVPVTLGY